MRNSGLRKNDPRLNDFINNLKKVHKNSGSEGGSPETQKLNRETFKRYGLQYVMTFSGVSIGKPDAVLSKLLQYLSNTLPVCLETIRFLVILVKLVHFILLLVLCSWTVNQNDL